MARCALCERLISDDDVLANRPGCTYCKGHAPMDDLPKMLAAQERAWIIFALIRTKGNKNRAAIYLGVKRTSLVEKLKRLGITVKWSADKPELMCVDDFNGFM